MIYWFTPGWWPAAAPAHQRRADPRWTKLDGKKRRTKIKGRPVLTVDGVIPLGGPQKHPSPRDHLGSGPPRRRVAGFFFFFFFFFFPPPPEMGGSPEMTQSKLESPRQRFAGRLMDSARFCTQDTARELFALEELEKWQARRAEKKKGPKEGRTWQALTVMDPRKLRVR